MEEEIIYPYFVPFASEEAALAKIASINEALRPTWTDGTTNNYDNPRKDVNGLWWVLVEAYVLEHFSEEEIELKKQYEQIEFPTEQ